jgi:hypothetical protein
MPEHFAAIARATRSFDFPTEPALLVGCAPPIVHPRDPALGLSAVRAMQDFVGLRVLSQ